MQIDQDDPRRADVRALLRAHLDDMRRHSPPQSIHALDTEALCRPDVTFWTARDTGELLGCAALLALDDRHGEIKSMKTAAGHLRRGVAARLLQHVIDEAQRRPIRA